MISGPAKSERPSSPAAGNPPILAPMTEPSSQDSNPAASREPSTAPLPPGAADCLTRLPRLARWSAAAGLAISLLYLVAGRVAIQLGWMDRVVFATREKAHFDPLLLGGLVFVLFALLPALVLGAATGQTGGSGPGTKAGGLEEERRLQALKRWARWDSAALLLWVLYPLVYVMPRLHGIASSVPEFLLSKMRNEGFDIQNRLMAYGMGFFFLALLLWKAGACFRLLLEVCAENWRAVRRGFLGLCAAVFVFTGFWTSAEYPPTGDEPHYLLMAHSIVFDHDLRLENNYANQDYLAFRDRLEPQVTPDSANSLSRHEIAFPVLIAPAYALGGRMGVVLFLNALAALALWQLLGMLRDLLGDPRTALKTAAAIGFLTPFCIYSSQVFPEAAAALLLTLTLRLALSQRMETWYGLPLLCLCLVTLPLLKIRFLLLAFGVFVLAFFHHEHRIRNLLFLPLLLLPPMLFLMLLLIWIDTVYLGSYAYVGKFLIVLDQMTTHASFPGFLPCFLAGLFDQGSGLIVYAPVLFLAFAGLVPAWRSNRSMAFFLAQVPMWYCLVKSPYWQAGWCPPGRYWVCVLPVAGIFLGHALRVKGRLGVLLASALAILSGVILFALTALPPLRYPMQDGGSALLAILTKATGLPFTRMLPNCCDPTQASAYAWIGPILLVAACFLLGALGERRGPASGQALVEGSNG